MSMRFKPMVVNFFKHCPPLYRIISLLYHAVNQSFHPGNPGAPQAITQALEKAKTLNTQTGRDFYGFGVFRGYTLWHAQQTCNKLGLEGVRFYGFDSFKGFPEIEGIDKANKEFYAGQFACSLEKTKKYLNDHQVDWSTLHLVEGFYRDTLTDTLKSKIQFRPAMVAFFDCDLYHSTYDALKWLTPFVTEGTLLLFDDWITYGKSTKLGQPKAFYDFLKENPNFEAEDLGRFEIKGNWFLIHQLS